MSEAKTSGRPAVFLDRDGVVNQAVVRRGMPYPPASVHELVLAEGAVQAIADLSAAGYVCVVVTNQPDIARGSSSWDTVWAIHQAIAAQTALRHFYVCPHDDASACCCRKPLPGLLLQAAAELGLDLSRSYLVGDRWRDMAAAEGAGVPSFFVDHGWQERRPERWDWRVHSLAEAATLILSRPISEKQHEKSK